MKVDGTERMQQLRRSDPREVGGYTLLGRLGTGGMGVVFLARAGDGRLVAVKMVHAELAGDEEFRGRFRSEVNRARQVPPFCTAEVLDADPDHEPPYLVVEYVDGPSLGQVVEERGPLTHANVHAVAVGVASALTAIHDAGVIHRDLKPRNVMLAPGTPKVIDFGIARAFEATSQHTRTDQMVGTVAYMAPERFDAEPGTPLTPAADIFAWGAVVAFAATGRTPFDGDSPPVTATRILTRPPDLDGLPDSLRDLVAWSLAKNPAARPTARQLLDVLLTGSSQQLAGAVTGRPGAVGYTEDTGAVRRNVQQRRGAESWDGDETGDPWPREAGPDRVVFTPYPPDAGGRTPGACTAGAHARRGGRSRSTTVLVAATILTAIALAVGGVATLLGRSPATPPGTLASPLSAVADPTPPERSAVRSEFNSRCLAARGADVRMLSCTTDDAQAWRWTPEGTLTLGDDCLEIEDAATTDGAVVRLAACDGSAGQQWRWTPGRDVVNPAADKCLDIVDRNPDDGAGLQLWTCGGTSNQKWLLPGD